MLLRENVLYTTVFNKFETNASVSSAVFKSLATWNDKVKCDVSREKALRREVRAQYTGVRAEFHSTVSGGKRADTFRVVYAIIGRS